MKVRRSTLHPSMVMFGYIGMLLVTVFALILWPFSRPLLWFLFSLMTVFFLFAFLVISLSMVLIFQAVRQSLSSKLDKLGRRNPNHASSAISPGMVSRSSDLWDRWLDG